MAEPLLRIGAAYIRVSDERQDEYSPDSQLKKYGNMPRKRDTRYPMTMCFMMTVSQASLPAGTDCN